VETRGWHEGRRKGGGAHIMDLWTYGTRKVCLRVISRSVIQTGWEEIWPYGPEREKFNCKKTGEMNQKE